MANVADQVKAHLRSIAHSISHADAELAVRNIMSAKIFKGKLKPWFTKKWFLQMQKWCLAYRPDDLILCNTNNSTERLNKYLKYDDLSGYKNCSLSELLSVVIESFIPKHYQKYVELNIRYGDGCKKYAPGIPEFLRNIPKQIVEILLDKMYSVTDDLSVTKLENATFTATSVEEGTGLLRNYTTFLGTNKKFCSCTCNNFKRYRMLRTQFFAIFKSVKAKFDDLTKLFLNNPYHI